MYFVICFTFFNVYSQERRHSAIRELLRVLRPGGKALIYVWALEQELHKVKSNYLKESKIRLKEESKFKCKGTKDEVKKENEEMKKKDLSGENNESSNKQVDKCDKTNNPCEITSEDKIKNKTWCNSLNVHVNGTNFDTQDLLVPWHLRGQKAGKDSEDSSIKQSNLFHRYYHVFQQGELETLCNNVDGAKVISSYYDKGNWCCILEKV